MRKIALVLIMSVGVCLVRAQNSALVQVVKGTVNDEQSGSYLRNATVSIEGNGSVTDSLGSFRLTDVPIGRQTIRVTLIGYEDAVISKW